MRKSLKIGIAALAITLSLAGTALAGQWKQDNAGWWYQNDDGSYPVSSWMQNNGKWYYFGDNGYMKTGWLDLNGSWYYLNPSGEMQTTSITLADGVTYNFDASGMCINRWAGAADMTYYDPKTATDKSVGAELAERDYLKRINEGVDWSTNKYPQDLYSNPDRYSNGNDDWDDDDWDDDDWDDDDWD